MFEDKNLLEHINKYKEKSLEERKKDPLRYVFRWNDGTQNHKLDNVTKDGKTIKKWFESLMEGSTKDEKESENKETVYFVLLELFGKDFEFGGCQYHDNGIKTIPKVKLWDKVNKKEVKKVVYRQ